MADQALLVYILYVHGMIFVPLVHCLIDEYHFINTPKTWTDSQQYCREHFTDLATIETQEDVSRIAIPAGGFGWIGLHDDPSAWKKFMTDDPNSWRWSATGTTSPGGYQNWHSNEPNNYAGKEYCVFIQYMVWKDYDCTKHEPCVCYEVQSGIKQFFLVNDANRTWAECQSVCREQYHDLAMIESKTEDEAVLEALGAEPSAWIGLKREAWVWSDFSNSTFRNWYPGSPDNYNYNQQCVNMNDNGIMHDWICEGKLPFICHEVKPRASVFHTEIRIQTKGDLSEAGVTEELLRLIEERLVEKYPEANFKLQWIRESAQITAVALRECSPGQH